MMANRIKHRACFTKKRKSKKLKREDKIDRERLRALKRSH